MNLDLTNVESVTFGALPKGTYPVIAETVDVHRTKNNDGAYISIMFTVIDGKYKNRKIFENFNFQNPNEDAVKMGLGRLRNFMEAAGAKSFKLADPAHLAGMAARATVAIESKEDFEDRNKVTAFIPLNEKEEAIASVFLKQAQPGVQQHDHGQGGNSTPNLNVNGANPGSGSFPF